MFARFQISADDVDRAIRPLGDRDDLLTEVDGDTLGLDIVRSPREVVREFLPRGYRRADIDEGHETALRVEIVQESYRRLGVSKSREVLDPAFVDGLYIRTDR